MNVYVGKTMHVGRPFVCANEIIEGKPREDHHTSGPCEGHHTEATSEHQHRHKQTAMPTRTLSHKHTCSHILALQNRFVSCSLSNPPTHGNQQGTHAVDQKEDKALCRKSELMSRASYCATTQTLLHVLLINEAGVRPCRTNANFSFLNGQYRLIVQTRAITD